MMKWHCLYVWLTVLMPLLLPAQSVRFEASADARQVLLGDYLQVTFSLHNAEGSDFRPPAFNDCQLLAGPGSSVQTTIINGQISKTIAYTYTLRPERKGRLTIGPASISVGGRRLTTKPLDITVLEAPAGGAGGGEKEVFIRAEISAADAYIGQQLVLDYKLYSQRDISHLNLLSESDYAGFYVQEVSTYDKQPQREIFEGQAYYTQVLKRVLLFPQEAGKLRIDPLSVQLEAVVGGRMPGGFFSRLETELLPASTQALAINVLPLPRPVPPNFSGGIGEYTLEASISPAVISTDDAARLRLVIRGAGDIKRINPPSLQLSDSIELYDPKVIRETYTEGPEGVQGVKEIEYLLVGRTAGTYRLRPQLTVFSPEQKDWQTLQAAELSLRVQSGRPAGTSGLPPAGAQSGKPAPSGSLWWWLFGLLPAASVGWFLWRRRQRRRPATAEPAVYKPAKANALQKQLARAQVHKEAGDMTAFYDEIYRAIWQYASSASSGGTAELSRQQLQAQLSARWGEDKASRMLRLLAACERALFSGQPADGDAEADWAEAQALLSTCV